MTSEEIMDKDRATTLISSYFEAENWTGARKVIKSQLKEAPNDHWLLTRLSTTYYEERDYKEALRWAKRAHEIVPDCPLVLWDLAGAYDMGGMPSEAIKYYERILKKGSRGIEAMAADECAEGPAWALSLVIDTIYRASLCLKKLGCKEAALELMKNYQRMA